jgi:pantoate--beta-alanine ligase
VVSIFVNPTQFGPGEDLASYPRDLEGDEAALADLGDDAPDLVFAPSVEEMYPHERVTTVKVEGLTDVLCGASRPGHFDGVGTVVTKLLNIVEPDVAAFGRKDFQQLTIIRALVRDLDLPVEILPTPTVREPDGLALSSRNAYLDDDERGAALALSQALADAVEAARAARADGRAPDPQVLAEAARATLAAQPLVRPDYLEVRDPDTLAPPDPATGGEADGGRDPARGGGDGTTGPRLLVAVAAHVGPARLIDNVVVGDLDDEDRLLAATGRAG